MPVTTSPFFGINYGWTTGQAGWGDPVNTNFKVLSFLGKGAVDSFVAALPGSPSEGDSVVLTTDNKFYVRLSGAWLFITPQAGQEVNEISTGKRWQFSGSVWVEIASTESLKARVEDLEQFDVDLADTTDPLKGAGFVGWSRSPLTGGVDNVHRWLDGQSVNVYEETFVSLITSKPNPIDPKTWDWTPAIQAGIDYLNSIGGGALWFPTSVYPITTVTMKAGVALVGPTRRLTNVMALATGSIFGSPVLEASGTSTAAVVFPSDSWAAGISGLAIDCEAKAAGHGILLDDAAGVLRPGNWLRDVLIYSAPDRGVLIEAGNKEPSFERVFVRGGAAFGTAVTQVGWENNTTDAKFIDCFTGFCVLKGIHDNGGASRWEGCDVFGNQQIGVEVSGTSSRWVELQVDGSGSRGLHLNGADDANFINYTSLGNCASISDADVVVTGDCRSIQFVAPNMRGTIGTATHAFKEEGNNHAQVLGGVIGTSYGAPFDDRALAYWFIEGLANPIRELRVTAVPGVELNPNPFFTNYSAGAPVGWSLRNAATSVLRTTDLPTGGFLTGVTITSSATGVSGIQVDLTADLAKYLGMRIKVRGLFKGDSSTFLGNQRIDVFMGAAGDAVEIIPNDGSWGKRAVDAVIPLTATFLQIRLVAANGTTAGLLLGSTAVSIHIY